MKTRTNTTFELDEHDHPIATRHKDGSVSFHQPYGDRDSKRGFAIRLTAAQLPDLYALIAALESHPDEEPEGPGPDLSLESDWDATQGKGGAQ